MKLVGIDNISLKTVLLGRVMLVMRFTCGHVCKRPLEADLVVFHEQLKRTRKYKSEDQITYCVMTVTCKQSSLKRR